MSTCDGRRRRKAAFCKGASERPLWAHCRHPSRVTDRASRSGDDPTGLSRSVLLRPLMWRFTQTPHRSGCGRQAPDSRLDARRVSRRAVDDPARVPRRTFSVPYPGNHLRATQRAWSRSSGWWRRSPGQASWCSIRSVVRAQPGDGRQPWPAAVRNCVRSRASAVRRSGILDEKRSSVPSPLATDCEGGGAWMLWRSPRDGATAACESGANCFRIYPHGRCARGADRLRSSRTKAEPRP